MGLEEVKQGDDVTWQAILELWARVFPEWSTPDKNLAFVSEYYNENPSLTAYVWREPTQGKDVPLGILACAVVIIRPYEYDHLAQKKVNISFVCNMAVHPRFQRRGIGTLFFSALLRSKPRPLMLECTPALASFYEQCQKPLFRSKVHEESGQLTMFFDWMPGNQ